MLDSNQVQPVISSVVTPVALEGFKTPLLNEYPGASAAYSLRRLKSWDDGGRVVRVRRSSDNAEADFKASEVSDGTLVTWVGAGNDGFVPTWYDQSGNGNNLTNSIAIQQRKIVDAGVLVTEGGEPSIAGNIYSYAFDSPVILTADFSILTLANLGASQSLLGGTGSSPRLRIFDTSNEVVNDTGGEVNLRNTNNPPTLHTFDGTRVLTGLYRNSDSVSLNIAGETTASSPLTLSGTFTFTRAFTRDNNNNPMTGKCQEMIIWPSDIR